MQMALFPLLAIINVATFEAVQPVTELAKIPSNSRLASIPSSVRA